MSEMINIDLDIMKRFRRILHLFRSSENSFLLHQLCRYQKPLHFGLWGAGDGYA